MSNVTGVCFNHLNYCIGIGQSHSVNQIRATNNQSFSVILCIRRTLSCSRNSVPCISIYFCQSIKDTFAALTSNSCKCIRVRKFCVPNKMHAIFINVSCKKIALFSLQIAWMVQKKMDLSCQFGISISAWLGTGQ